MELIYDLMTNPELVFALFCGMLMIFGGLAVACIGAFLRWIDTCFTGLGEFLTSLALYISAKTKEIAIKEAPDVDK